MKVFRRTLIDRKSHYLIHHQHLVSYYHQNFLTIQRKTQRDNVIQIISNILCDIEKKPPLKTFEDVQTLLSQGKKREVKLLMRDNAWPINSPIRAQLWPAICSQHQIGKSMLEGYYWDMVNQV